MDFTTKHLCYAIIEGQEQYPQPKSHMGWIWKQNKKTCPTEMTELVFISGLKNAGPVEDL